MLPAAPLFFVFRQRYSACPSWWTTISMRRGVGGRLRGGGNSVWLATRRCCAACGGSPGSPSTTSILFVGGVGVDHGRWPTNMFAAAHSCLRCRDWTACTYQRRRRHATRPPACASPSCTAPPNLTAMLLRRHLPPPCHLFCCMFCYLRGRKTLPGYASSCLAVSNMLDVKAFRSGR